MSRCCIKKLLLRLSISELGRLQLICPVMRNNRSRAQVSTLLPFRVNVMEANDWQISSFQTHEPVCFLRPTFKTTAGYCQVPTY